MAMNEWEFIGQEILVELGKFGTNCKFINRCGLVAEERISLSNPHSSWPSVTTNGKFQKKRPLAPS